MAKIALALMVAFTLLIAPAVADDGTDDSDDEAVGPAYEPLDHGEESNDSPGFGVGLVVLGLAGLVMRRRR